MYCPVLYLLQLVVGRYKALTDFFRQHGLIDFWILRAYFAPGIQEIVREKHDGSKQ
jgi:hypothetical protein